MDLTDVVDGALTQAASGGANQAEAFTARSRTLSIYVEDSRVKNLEEKYDLGLSVRVATSRRMGEASSTVSSREKVEECVASALRAARVSEPDPHFIGFALGGEPTITRPSVWNHQVAELDTRTLSAKVMDLVDACTSSGDFKVPRGLIRTATIETEVGNSNGMSATHRSTLVYLHFTSMTRSGRAGEGEVSFHSTRLDFDAEALGLRLAEGARNSAIATPMRGRMECPVFLTPHQLANMFESSIGFSINSENVNRLRSAWARRLGEEVASSSVTITDDPSDARGVLSATHDDEGVPTRANPVIEKGVLRSFLYDTYNASMAGMQSTGNGLRRTSINSQSIYQRPVSVSPINMLVQPGSKSRERLLDSFDRAILIERFAWPQVNPVTGGIGLEVRCAHVLEGGETVRTVKNALLTGNMYDSLKKVAGIANDNDVQGSWIVPTMGFEGLEVVGSP